MDHRVKSGGDLYADDLTWREQEVLILLSDHLSNREIAERLHLAESTVKDYVSRISDSNGGDGVTWTALIDNFPIEFIEHCKETGVLIANPTNDLKAILGEGE